MSRRHDQSYKLLFSLPLAIDHLFRSCIDDDLADELDFDRVEYLATERTDSGLVRSQADLVCRIHFRGSSRYLLFGAEFQSAEDRYMALRALVYVAAAYQGLVESKPRQRGLGPAGTLPPSLTVTIYNGERPWTAPEDVRDLIEPVQGRLADRQPRLRHQVVDMRELARQSPPERNLVSWMASLELDPSSGNVARVVLEVRREYPGPEHARVREVFRVWLLGAAESWGIDDDALELVKSLKEAEMIYAGVEKLKREHFARLARGAGEDPGRGPRRGPCRGPSRGPSLADPSTGTVEVRCGDGRPSLQCARWNQRAGTLHPDRRPDHRVRERRGTAGARPPELEGRSGGYGDGSTGTKRRDAG